MQQMDRWRGSTSGISSGVEALPAMASPVTSLSFCSPKFLMYVLL